MTSKKKQPRTFQCREPLWSRFEQMANELECSVDYLINDAMKQYARQRGYLGDAHTTENSSVGPAPSTTGGMPPPPPPPPPAQRHKPPLPRPSALEITSDGGVTMSPGPPNAAARRQVPPALPATPPPAPPIPAPPQFPAPAAGRRPPPPPRAPSARSAAPPPLPPMHASAHPPTPHLGSPRNGAELTIQYQGQVFPVTKDRYVIGRGKQTSDLTIKDPNVSRQHALIEFSAGQYYIVDMGSTNGVEFNGQRVQRKIIGDGDRFRICEHELVFGFH